jgi:hypothetical protein
MFRWPKISIRGKDSTPISLACLLLSSLPPSLPLPPTLPSSLRPSLPPPSLDRFKIRSPNNDGLLLFRPPWLVLHKNAQHIREKRSSLLLSSLLHHSFFDIFLLESSTHLSHQLLSLKPSKSLTNSWRSTMGLRVQTRNCSLQLARMVPLGRVKRLLGK